MSSSRFLLPKASGSAISMFLIRRRSKISTFWIAKSCGLTERWCVSIRIPFVNLAAQDHEILAWPGRHSALLISTFPDWPAFAEWYGRISKLTDEVTPELAEKASELTRGAKSDRDKVLAAYNYVSALRYVAI